MAYELDFHPSSKIHSVFHIVLLKPYHSNKNTTTHHSGDNPPIFSPPPNTLYDSELNSEHSKNNLTPFNTLLPPHMDSSPNNEISSTNNTCPPSMATIARPFTSHVTHPRASDIINTAYNNIKTHPHSIKTISPSANHPINTHPHVINATIVTHLPFPTLQIHPNASLTHSNKPAQPTPKTAPTSPTTLSPPLIHLTRPNNIQSQHLLHIPHSWPNQIHHPTKASYQIIAL